MCEGETSAYWVNVYRGGMAACGSVHLSRDLAEQAAGLGCVVCVEVKSGVGLGATLFNMKRQGDEQ